MRAGRDIARFDAGPAEIGQKPPILVPLRREAQEQCQLRLVVVDAAAEPQQAKDAERGRQRQRIARILGNMRVEPRHRLGAEPVDDERDRLDMAAFARRDPLGEVAGARCGFLRLRDPRLHLAEPRPRDMGKREVRVGVERGIEQRLGAGIGRQHQIDGTDVALDRVRRVCRQRQPKSIRQRHRALPFI